MQPETRPISRVEEQMNARRARILDCAREIIAEQGFEGLTIRGLAEAARVTTPTIYNLVGSKNQVLAAVIADRVERFLREIEGSEGDVIAVVQANLRELLRMPRYYRAILPVLFGSDEAAEPRRVVGQAVSSQIEAGLARLMEEGALEAWVDAKALTTQIQASLGGAAIAWARGQTSDAAFAKQELYGTALLLASVARGAKRAEYLNLARDQQPAGRRRR